MLSADSLRLPSACPSDLPSAAFPSSLLRRLPLPAFTRSITLPHALAYNRLYMLLLVRYILVPLPWTPFFDIYFPLSEAAKLHQLTSPPSGKPLIYFLYFFMLFFTFFKKSMKK